MRRERDSLGEVEIPEDRYWGPQTARALDYFPDVGPRMPSSVIRAFGLQKCAAARANMTLGTLDEQLGAWIVQATLEMADGAFNDHFPLPVWQTGSGTQTNMCANEVIANRANELSGAGLGTRNPVHPNDHVNRSQSSNDSFPTVMHVAALCEVEDRLLPVLDELRDCLERQGRHFEGIVRLGRTHLNDAVPVRLSQSFEGWSSGLASGRERLKAAAEDLRLVPQGGTAAGSGLNAPPEFDARFCAALSELANTRFEPHPVKVEGMAAHDALAALSGTLKNVAFTLMHIANDIRHLASGPRAGLCELSLPEDGLSSSIMPGKRNATLAEAIVQICQRVAGNDATVQMANATSLYELNVSKPVMIAAILESIQLLASGIPRFSIFIGGITPNRHQMSSNVERSLMLATALTPELGYDRVSEITRQAEKNGLSIREAVVQAGLLSEERFNELVDPTCLAGKGPEPGSS